MKHYSDSLIQGTVWSNAGPDCNAMLDMLTYRAISGHLGEEIELEITGGFLREQGSLLGVTYVEEPRGYVANVTAGLILLDFLLLVRELATGKKNLVRDK